MSGHAPWRSHGAVAVLGTGAALPGEPIATEALIARLEAGFSTIPARAALAVARRMAIRTRHHARAWAARGEGPMPGRANPDLADQAVRAALRQAGLRPDDLGFLIGHTATPAQPLPSNIAFVADRLGYAGPHMEMRGACTGFASALAVAFGLLAAPGARPVAIVGSETGSVFFDPAAAASDSGQLVNLVQMGDGAGAIVLGHDARNTDRISAAWSGAVGLGHPPGLQMRRGGSSAPVGGEEPLDFDHDHAAIAATGVRLFEAGAQAAAIAGAVLTDVAQIVPHQVSGRIGDQLAAHFGVDPARFFVNADTLGNTGSAAIWLALDALRARGMASGARAVVLGAEATKHMYGGFVYEQH